MEKEKESLNPPQQVEAVVVSHMVVNPKEGIRSVEREPRRSHSRNDSSVSLASSIVKGTTLLCFRMSDVAVSILVLLPLTIAFWRGIWQIMDYYSEEYGLDPWLSMGLGNGIPLLLYVFQEPLKHHIHPRKMNYILFYIITRFVLIIHSFGFVD